MESGFGMAVHFRDAVSSDVDPVDVGTLRCAPLSMPGQEFGERAISRRQSGIVASTDVANHIFHAIVVEINELHFLWMTDAEILYFFVGIIWEDVSLAVEEDGMVVAIFMAANDVHVAISVEIGVVDNSMFVAESRLKVAHVDEVSISSAVLGPVRAASWVVANHVSFAVSVHVDPLEVSALAVCFIKHN